MLLLLLVTAIILNCNGQDDGISGDTGEVVNILDELLQLDDTGDEDTTTMEPTTPSTGLAPEDIGDPVDANGASKR